MYYANEPIHDELRTIANEIEKELELGELDMYEGGKRLYEQMNHYADGIMMSEVFAVIRGMEYCEIAMDWYLHELL